MSTQLADWLVWAGVGAVFGLIMLAYSISEARE